MVKMDANSVRSSTAIVVAIIVWVGGDGGSVAVVGGGSFKCGLWNSGFPFRKGRGFSRSFLCFIRGKHGWIDGDETTVLEGYNEKEKLKQIVLFDHQIRGREMFLSYDKTVCVICKLKSKNRGSPQYSFGSQRKSIFLLGKIFFYCGFSYTLNINNPLVDIHIVKGENKKFSHLKHESWCEKERMMSIGIL